MCTWPSVSEYIAADVELEAVLALGLGAVIADSHRQEVEHEVRVSFIIV